MNRRLPHRADRPRQQRQKGITLLVALAMVLIIGLMSVSVMKSSLTSDMVANNARAQTSAQQAAELALRYCERQALAETNGTVTGFILTTQSPENWTVFAKWFPLSSATAKLVPTSVLTSSDGSITPIQPQCMAENTNLADGTAVIRVTARGFSADYQADANGRTKRGSVVWLQSTLTFG